MVFFLVGAGGAAAWYMLSQTSGFGPAGGVDLERAGVLPDKPPTVVKAQPEPKEQPPAEEDGGDEEVADGEAESGADAEGIPGDVKVAKRDTKKPVAKKRRKSKRKRKKRKKRKRKDKTVASKRERATGFYKLGNQLIRKKKFPAALRAFSNALKADPGLIVVHRSMGIVYAQLGKTNKACGAYWKYMKALPKNSSELPALKRILKGCKKK